jgi:hypothetical protein
MTRVLHFAGLGVGALLSLATAAHAQPAAAPLATSGASQPAAQTDTPGEIGVICLTNACMKTVSGPPRDAAAATRAIETGDIEKLMMAGGTPEDVIAALQSRLRNDPNAIFNPESANQAPLSLWMSSTERHMNEGAVPQFIQNNGRTSLAFFSPSGHLDAVTTVPGMNGAGIPLRGVAYDVPAPAPPPPPPPPFGQFSAQ